MILIQTVQAQANLPASQTAAFAGFEFRTESPNVEDDILCNETFLQDEDIVFRFTRPEANHVDIRQADSYIGSMEMQLPYTATHLQGPRESQTQIDPKTNTTTMDILPEPLTICLLAVGFVAIGLRRNRGR